MEISARHHLRSDAVAEITADLADSFGVEPSGETFEAISFTDSELEVVLVDGDPEIVRLPTGTVYTVQGANSVEPTKGVVVVDAGAVGFVSNGADVMRPGIVDADPDIKPDDPVIIVEETHNKALAIGIARVPGEEMLGDQGKVIESVHHVGDELFTFTP